MFAASERASWGQSLRRPLTRRRALARASLGAAGLLVAAEAACSSAGSTPKPKPAAGQAKGSATASTQAAKQPKRGGTITHGGGPGGGTLDADGRTVDPHIQTGLAGRGLRLVYQGLLAYNQRTYVVEPELAQKWEQPSQTEYLFHLQPGVKWHNKPPAGGRELTVDDIIYSFGRARTDNPAFTTRSLLTGIDKIEAPDKATLRMATKAPNVATLINLASDTLMVLAPEVVDKAGKFTTAESAVGTGPFVMTALQDKIGNEYARNPDYWKPGLPYLDRVRTPYFTDPGTAYAAFQSGQLDIVLLPGTAVKDYITQQGKGYTPDWNTDDSSAMSVPNTQAKPLNDARAMKALRLLLDHEEFRTAWAEIWFGHGRNGSIFTTALQDTWDFTDQEYLNFLEWKQPKDEAVKEGLALLSAAGFSKDSPLSFEIATPTDQANSAAATLHQAQWRKFGQGVLDVRIKQYDLASYIPVRNSGQFTYMVIGNSGSVVDPDSWFTELYRSDGSKNFQRFKDAKLDGMIDQQRAIFNLDQRKAAVKAIIRYMIDAGMTVEFINRYQLDGVAAKVQTFAPEYYIVGRQYEHIWLNS